MYIATCKKSFIKETKITKYSFYIYKDKEYNCNLISDYNIRVYNESLTEERNYYDFTINEWSKFFYSNQELRKNKLKKIKKLFK